MDIVIPPGSASTAEVLEPKTVKPKVKKAVVKKKVVKTKKAPAKPRKAKRPKVVKTKPKAKKAVKTMAANARTERLDMRLTKAEKAKVHTRASKLRRTVTSIVIEAIEKIK